MELNYNTTTDTVTLRYEDKKIQTDNTFESIRILLQTDIKFHIIEKDNSFIVTKDLSTATGDTLIHAGLKCIAMNSSKKYKHLIQEISINTYHEKIDSQLIEDAFNPQSKTYMKDIIPEKEYEQNIHKYITGELKTIPNCKQ